VEFPIQPIKKKNLESYDHKNREIAYEFAKRVKKEAGPYIKMIVLFGSTARKQEAGDIDILLVLDDTMFDLSAEFVQTYRVIVENLIISISRKLHVTTFRLTQFWEYIRAGDPVAINILRDGIALLDPGIFDPLQMLLYQGRIRPTPESAYTYFARAPITLETSKRRLLQGTLDLYWAVIDAAHAALIKINCIPPSPEHVAGLLDERLVKPGLLEKRYVKTVDRFYHLSRGILHNQITHIDGDTFDQYVKEAHAFIEAMRPFVEK
jgi:predicted nucleotidyltransferase